jgi:hypothetical protein
LPLGCPHQICRLHGAVIGGGEDGITAQHLVRAQAAARCGDGRFLVLAAFKVDPQRQPLARGLQLRTNAPATVSISGGAEENAESAIPANSLVHLVCISATAWVGFMVHGTTLAVVPAAAAA